MTGSPMVTLQHVLDMIDGRDAAVCIGGFGSPTDEPHDRIGVFDWTRGELWLDAWLPHSSLSSLLAENVASGGWDTLFATPWRVAWAERGGVLKVWSPNGPLLAHDGKRLVWPSGRCPPDGFHGTAVRSFLAPGWSERGLKLDGPEPYTFVEVNEVLTPFYDGLDLLADTCWLHDLGRLLAERLGIPYIDGV